MNKIVNYIINIAKFIWQFPQNVLALYIEGVLCLAAKRRGKLDGINLIVTEVFRSSMSLGEYVFITPYTTFDVIKHEYGHSKQSLILGPLYLIVIGIPSLLHNVIHYLCHRIGINWDYYKFYTEAWANKLGKVDLKQNY